MAKTVYSIVTILLIPIVPIKGTTYPHNIKIWNKQEHTIKIIKISNSIQSKDVSIFVKRRIDGCQNWKEYTHTFFFLYLKLYAHTFIVPFNSTHIHKACTAYICTTYMSYKGITCKDIKEDHSHLLRLAVTQKLTV